MLPEPTFTFTIPSVYDDTALDCRVYSPPHSIINSVDTTWRPRGATIAHPYAPMGGSYDDAVVLSAVAECLTNGYVVGTFNFRGAGSSKGRTSWQGKPEVEDYISFIGFFVHYIEGLRAPPLPSSTAHHIELSPDRSACETPLDSPVAGCNGVTLVIGGYSYGSLITAYLPAIDHVLQRFENVGKGSAEAEIRLRAGNLSAQWSKDAKYYHEAQAARKAGSLERLRVSGRAMAVVMGGDESDPGSRRTSHEGRRSIDAVRRSMDRSRMKLGLRKHSQIREVSDFVEATLASARIAPPQTRYLLISPLLPPISTLAVMFSKHLPRDKEKFVKDPTLAIYGGEDFFTSERKVRGWAEGLKAIPGSQFSFHEIAQAGHFWREEGSDSQMRSAIRQWLKGITANDVLLCISRLSSPGLLSPVSL